MSDMSPEEITLDDWKRYARYWEQQARKNADVLRDAGYTVRAITNYVQTGDKNRAINDLENLAAVIKHATRPRAARAEPSTKTTSKGNNEHE